MTDKLVTSLAEEENCEEEVFVEEIVDKRKNPTTGKVEYLLKLKGGDQKDNIWELKENLPNCPRLIAEFECNVEQDCEEKENAVEEIVDKRKNPTMGKVEYLLKLKGDDQKDNNWELKENLPNHPRLIAEFECKTAEQNINSNKRKSESTATSSVVKKKRTKKSSRLERGVVPECIIGATKEMGQLMLLLQWPDTDETDLIPAKEANERFPDIVIQFYENRLVWD